MLVASPIPKVYTRYRDITARQQLWTSKLCTTTAPTMGAAVTRKSMGMEELHGRHLCKGNALIWPSSWAGQARGFWKASGRLLEGGGGERWDERGRWDILIYEVDWLYI
jgi:hypothetical protein